MELSIWFFFFALADDIDRYKVKDKKDWTKERERAERERG